MTFELVRAKEIEIVGEDDISMQSSSKSGRCSLGREVRDAKQRNGTADLIAPLQPASWPIPTSTTGGTTPARVFRAEWWRDKRASLTRSPACSPVRRSLVTSLGVALVDDAPSSQMPVLAPRFGATTRAGPTFSSADAAGGDFLADRPARDSINGSLAV